LGLQVGEKVQAAAEEVWEQQFAGWEKRDRGFEGVAGWVKHVCWRVA